jgi:hypothetical protein
LAGKSTKLVGQWTDVTKSTTVTFTSTKLVDLPAKLTGVTYYILQLDLITELTGWHFLYIIAKTKSARS